MRNLIRISTIVGLYLIAAFSSINAQEWSSEQKEVWAGVQKYWEIDNNNPVAFLKYFDDSYLGWSNNSETPGTKADAEKSFKYWTSKTKYQFNLLTPARIWVEGDYAFVHYYFTQVTEDSDGKPHEEKGRWTDILLKKNGTWMIVGDHGGANEDDD